MSWIVPHHLITVLDIHKKRISITASLYFSWEENNPGDECKRWQRNLEDRTLSEIWVCTKFQTELLFFRAILSGLWGNRGRLLGTMLFQFLKINTKMIVQRVIITLCSYRDKNNYIIYILWNQDDGICVRMQQHIWPLLDWLTVKKSGGMFPGDLRLEGISQDANRWIISLCTQFLVAVFMIYFPSLLSFKNHPAPICEGK